VAIATDVVIVGAGLAGLSLAVALSDMGLKTWIIDKGGLGSGASGVPIGLVNPAAAKQANLSWNATSCMSAIDKLLKRTRSHSEQIFYRKSGVLRPSVDAATLEAFSTSLARHSYPNGWAKWMEKEEVDAFQPNLVHAGGALWVNEGFTVDVVNYLKALAELLRQMDSQILTDTSVMKKSWLPNEQKWCVELSDGQEIRSNHIVTATGASILDDSDWKWLPVHKIKGQMAMYRSSEEIKWTHAIAGRGYVAHLDGYQWVIGSTFEHHFESIEPDMAGLKFLEQKVDSLLPDIRQKSILLQQWVGMRLGTPNRMPIIGRHPRSQGQWVFTGLGSKGLLYSAFLANLLASNMISATDIPIEVSTERLRY
jgi:glycine oxidase